MLGDDAADWVNVMTYDLHVCLFALSSDVVDTDSCSQGVWDSPADFIGSIVLGEFSFHISGKSLNIFVQLTPI